MKKYKVIANGVEYEVLIELVSDSEEAPKPATAEAKPEAAAGGSTRVKAPLAGTVTAVNVKAGDAVKKGQTLMILEAMKMENEILAPCDGSVKSLPVSAGRQVEAGEPLCDIG
jgi:biotin carboxyl carrier protein